MADDTFDLAVDTRELEAALKKLTAKLRSSVMKRALEAAGDVMLEAVVNHTPERTDEPTPEGDSLPPGMLKASMTKEVIAPNENGLLSESVSRGTAFSAGNPRVKVGPEKVGRSNKFGRVAYWQNNGWILTSHGAFNSAKNRKKGLDLRHKIRPIDGKHFLEAAFDESAEQAVDVFLATLADGLFNGTQQDAAGLSYPEGDSRDVEFD
jgi:hypothetical protein